MKQNKTECSMKIFESSDNELRFLNYILEAIKWVKPFQNFITNKKINGLLLINHKSGIKYKGKFPSCYSEDEVDKHYFTSDYRSYTDKLWKFVVKCNQKSSN